MSVIMEKKDEKKKDEGGLSQGHLFFESSTFSLESWRQKNATSSTPQRSKYVCLKPIFTLEKKEIEKRSE